MNAKIVVLASAFVVAFSPVSRGEGADSPGHEIGPPDCYARVMLIQEELEQIRIEMGRPKTGMCVLRVEHAAPREVLFQALSFLDKVNRVSLELTRSVMPAPDIPSGEIAPKHVYAVLDVALKVLDGLKAELDLPPHGVEPPRDANKIPSDVFQMIFQASRQTNLLMERPFSSRDVYKQVTVALGYVARLRARFPGSRVGEAPSFRRGLQPIDAHRRLLACVDRVIELSERSGIRTVGLPGCCERCALAGATDSYEIASLIVSELAYLHSRLEGVAPAFKAYPPGRKFPSHLYQRAGMLEAQLVELIDFVKN
ncbi:MAG: hypothetical protein IH989_00135 [Planctomycetes bacterium]|nr:hypothetical protein [Planctomycetota bacterium]